MKSFIAKTLSVLLISTALFSFTSIPGGEGFEVYVNGKVILQRFGKELYKPHTIRFAPGTENDEVTIRYHHCGQAGKNRVLTVKDGQDNVLKEIHFADASTTVSGMSCRVKDIISLKKGNNAVLKLYYRSSELPGGRLLVTIS
jgi:hypothetical protein